MDDNDAIKKIRAGIRACIGLRRNSSIVVTCKMAGPKVR
jgi:hypothetical protein